MSWLLPTAVMIVAMIAYAKGDISHFEWWVIALLASIWHQLYNINSGIKK